MTGLTWYLGMVTVTLGTVEMPIPVTTALTEQDPALQEVSPLQTCPQLPQLALSFWKFTQPPLQQFGASDLQTCPQLPQLATLDVRFTQPLGQLVVPRMRHDLGPRVTPVNVVGLLVTEDVVVVVVVVVATAVVVSAGILVQVEALHTMPVGHVLPHRPQFVALEASS